MNDMQSDNKLLTELNQIYKASIIPGWAFIVAIILYGVVLAVILQGGYDPDFDQSTHLALRLVFLAVCVADYFLAPIIIKAAMSNPTLSKGIQDQGMEFPELVKLRTAAFIGYALSEAPALLGFILGILSGQIIDYVIFLVISLFFFYRYFPRYAAWKSWALSIYSLDVNG